MENDTRSTRRREIELLTQWGTEIASRASRHYLSTVELEQFERREAITFGMIARERELRARVANETASLAVDDGHLLRAMVQGASEDYFRAYTRGHLSKEWWALRDAY